LKWPKASRDGFRPEREVSINQLAYLYGEYALRIAGVYNAAQQRSPIADQTAVIANGP
jgi:hypothetical protein